MVWPREEPERRFRSPRVIRVRRERIPWREPVLASGMCRRAASNSGVACAVCATEGSRQAAITRVRAVARRPERRGNG